MASQDTAVSPHSVGILLTSHMWLLGRTEAEVVYVESDEPSRSMVRREVSEGVTKTVG